MRRVIVCNESVLNDYDGKSRANIRRQELRANHQSDASRLATGHLGRRPISFPSAVEACCFEDYVCAFST